MRAVTSNSVQEPLQLIELPSLPVGANGIRVRVHAAGVNPVDWKMRAREFPLGVLAALLGPKGPFVVGVDFAGEVTETGPEVKSFRVGERVVGGTNFARGQRGSYADEVVVREDQLCKLPDSIDYAQAAALPIGTVTPWIAFREHHHVHAGHRVLVLGASGGVGHLAVQLARYLGAEAFGVCSEKNRAWVESLGAKVFDYSSGDPFTDAQKHGPYDVILHTVGSATYPIARWQTLLAPRGVLDLVQVRPADYPYIFWTTLRALFLRSSARVRTLLGSPTAARLAPIVAAVDEGKVQATIAQRFTLNDAEFAHQLSRDGKVVGKLVLEV